MDPSELNEIPPWEWPATAGRMLRGVLRNPNSNAAERLIAAELVGEIVVMSDEMADALLRILQKAGEPEDLRGQAAISFGPSLELADQEMMDGEFDDPEAVPISKEMFQRITGSLEELYRDPGTPKLVRRRILEASVRRQASWHEDAIREAYASGDRDWVLTAVFGMRYVGGFKAEVLEALKSDDSEIHYEAVLAAGNQDIEEAWPHIRSLLIDPGTEKDLRFAAIEAAGDIANEEALDFLKELTRSEDEDVADAAEEALSMARVVAGLEEDVDDQDDEEADEEDDEEEGDWVN